MELFTSRVEEMRERKHSGERRRMNERSSLTRRVKDDCRVWKRESERVRERERVRDTRAFRLDTFKCFTPFTILLLPSYARIHTVGLLLLF